MWKLLGKRNSSWLSLLCCLFFLLQPNAANMNDFNKIKGYIDVYSGFHSTLQIEYFGHTNCVTKLYNEFSNLKIISDSRIRYIVSKGPKYRFPSRIDFKKCREEIASALNDFGNRWCKREYVEPDALKEWKVSIFKIVDQRIKFYSQNTNLLPPKPKSTFRHLKQGIQDFHRKYVLVPANKAANNVVVVWRLHYINTLKQELSGSKAYKETSVEEKSVVHGHCNHLALKFSVCVKARQDRLPHFWFLFSYDVLVT